MRRITRVSILLFVLGSCAGADAQTDRPAHAAPETSTQGFTPPPKSAQELAERLEAMLAPLAHANSPGIAVEIIDHGHVVLNKGYGLARLKTKAPITPDTQFLLASCSKQFTAMAIMLLKQSGRLGYDDALTKYFPEFPGYARQITVRHLLHHTAGLQDYQSGMVQAGKVETRDHWPRSTDTPPSTYQPTAHDVLEFLAAQPNPLFFAGEQFQYSNSGYVVLAQIIEKASGMRYAEFLRKAIFEPLKMKDTFVYDERKQTGRSRASSYRGDIDIDYTPFNYVYGEDNVITTLNDLAKWDEELYKNTLLPASALADAFSPGDSKAGPTGYGFGWFVGERGGVRYYYHGGSWLGFRTFIGRCPAKEFTLIVLANSPAVLTQYLSPPQRLFVDFIASLPSAQ